MTTNRLPREREVEESCRGDLDGADLKSPAEGAEVGVDAELPEAEEPRRGGHGQADTVGGRYGGRPDGRQAARRRQMQLPQLRQSAQATGRREEQHPAIADGPEKTTGEEQEKHR